MVQNTNSTCYSELCITKRQIEIDIDRDLIPPNQTEKFRVERFMNSTKNVEKYLKKFTFILGVKVVLLFSKRKPLLSKKYYIARYSVFTESQCIL